MDLSDYAVTERQREIARAVNEQGSQAKAAKYLGISKGTVGNTITRLKVMAAAKGYSPEHGLNGKLSPVEVLKSRAILEDTRTGETVLQWTRTSVAHEVLLATMRGAVDELKSEIKPCKPIALQRKETDKELMTLYVLTDAHIGMKAWHEETGADWDLDIAERTIDSAMRHLIDKSPTSETAFFAQLGDGLHYDGMAGVTPTSGHLLDVDGRFQKVVRTAIRVFRRSIDLLLSKHRKVVVLFAAGNHDPASSAWLQESFVQLYADNPRVQILISPLPYYATTHGDCLLAFHHGHKSKTNKVHHTIMGEFRGLMGQTKQTFIHTGHMHSSAVLEFPGAIVEQHPTLASRDAYSSHGGWHSLRRMSAITYHRSHYEVERHQFYPTSHPLT